MITVAAVDPPLRPGLIDRYLVALARGGVRPAIAVNKLDLAGAADRAAAEVALAPHRDAGVACHLVSAASGAGIAALGEALRGATVVFVGHSSVGKSSLLNALDPAGARRTGAVRAFDGRGRHTTTSLALRVLTDGTRVIDTPGVREFGLGAVDADDLAAAFPDVAAHGARCRFRDCGHGDEPGCAVRAAVASGELPGARLRGWHRLRDGP